MIDASQLDIHQLAIGVLNINLGSAFVQFPESNKAHPSSWAVVFLRGSKPVGGVKRYFPFKVAWDLWEAVMVPVLQNPEYQVITRNGRNAINQASLNVGDYESLLTKIESGILNQFQSLGILPEGETEVDIGTGAPAEEVELWSEGHPRLVYRDIGR